MIRFFLHPLFDAAKPVAMSDVDVLDLPGLTSLANHMQVTRSMHSESMLTILDFLALERRRVINFGYHQRYANFMLISIP